MIYSDPELPVTERHYLLCHHVSAICKFHKGFVTATFWKVTEPLFKLFLLHKAGILPKDQVILSQKCFEEIWLCNRNTIPFIGLKQ